MQQNTITTMLMNQLKIKKPQMYQMLSQGIQNNINPMDLFNQVTNGYSKEQMDNLINQAKSMGFPPEVLEQVQKKG